MESKDYSTSKAACKPSRSNSAIPDIKEGSVHNISAKNGEGSDSSMSFKDHQSKENIHNSKDSYPFKNLRRTTENRGSCESGVSFKSGRSRDFIPDYKDRSPLKVISQECSPARSRRPILIIQERSPHRALVGGSLSPGISCASVRRNNAQGHFANVKETLSSPKKKSNFSIFEEEEEEEAVADDKDMESSEDQVSVKSGELSDSSLSCKSDRSKQGGINFDNTSPPSSQDLSPSDLEDTVNDEESVNSWDDELDKTLLEHGEDGWEHP